MVRNQMRRDERNKNHHFKQIRWSNRGAECECLVYVRKRATWLRALISVIRRDSRTLGALCRLQTIGRASSDATNDIVERGVSAARPINAHLMSHKIHLVHTKNNYRDRNRILIWLSLRESKT